MIKLEIQKVSIVPGHEIVPNYQSTLYKVETDKGVYVAAHGIPEHQKNETNDFIDWSKLVGKIIPANLRHYNDGSRWIGLSHQLGIKTPENSKHDAILSNWYLEKTRFGCYLVFDGSKDKFGEIMALMKKNKVLPKSSGQSYRPAKNGYQYDWYIRLPHKDNEDAEKDINNFLNLGELPKNLIKEWYIETNFYGHYVLIDGSEEYLNQVVNRLEAHDFSIRRRDRSYRAADNGHMYDWFIRLDFEGTREEVLEKVKSALEISVDVEETISQDDEESALIRKKLEDLISLPKEEIIKLSFELFKGLSDDIKKRETLIERSTRHSEAQLEEELESSRNDVAKYKTLYKQTEVRAKNENALLKSTISKLEAEIRLQENDESNDITQDQNVTTLQAEIKTLKKYLNDQEGTLTEYATEFEQQALDYKKELDNLRKEYQELQKENTFLKNRTNKHNHTNKIINYLELCFSKFENINIHPETSQIVVEKFPNATSLFDVLNKLDKRESVPARKINGSRLGWFEVNQHITTGNDSLGRIYYVKPEGQKKITVLAYHKSNDNDQQRFHKKIDHPEFLTNLSFENPISKSLH